MIQTVVFPPNLCDPDKDSAVIFRYIHKERTLRHQDFLEIRMSIPLILLADDEPHITHIIAHKLKRAGMEVIVVEDGEMALKEAISRKPDAIVTDLQMPYLSGIELAEQLSKNPDCANIPIILLTARGYAVEDEIEKLPSIRRLLSKPFSAKDLLGYINDLLEEGKDSTDSLGKCA